jgi:putative oxidoreductase
MAQDWRHIIERAALSESMPHRVRVALTILRAGTAVTLIIHGVARTALGIVDDFGGALTAWGFPLGLALAWTITVVEIVGGAAMAAGYLIRPIAAWFAFQLAMGVYLIHARAGWFVVGAGRNGMEFSVLLILCLGVIAMTSSDGLTLTQRRRRIQA